MIGRQQELRVLEAAWQKDSFQFFVMYGRRRVGKTTILQEFIKTHRAIFFPAQEKNDALNLQDFSRAVQTYFTGDFLAPFPDWEKAFSYIGRQAAGNQRVVLIIDEFPFLAAQNGAMKSMLQHAIDHDWQKKNLFLILCGSSVSFMVNEIMGYKSPLYGRITGQLEVKPFDYLDAAAFYPAYSRENQLLAYGILGGIPRYLAAFRETVDIEQNIATEILSENAFLHEEPQMLLRMELREPGIYNSILEAIANGANTLMTIADRIHEDRSKCAKYLVTLQSIHLVDKVVPCGQPPSSRKGIYVLTDFYYTFWYRYVFSRETYYELMGPEAAARNVMESINEYMGPVFERICQQYLLRQAKAGRLPFIPRKIGKWWGTNPVIKAQDDVDILAISASGTEGLFCECKYRNQPMPMEEYEDLLTATMAFPEITKRHLVFFSKGGYTQPVRDRAAREGARLLTIQDLYAGVETSCNRNYYKESFLP